MKMRYTAHLIVVVFYMLCMTSKAEFQLLSKPVVEPSSSESNAEPYELSLEQLLEVPVSIGSLTLSNQHTMPMSMTKITREQIQMTPARDITDLMEIYVPGVTFQDHSHGAMVGMRGIVSDRPYKILLLIDGRPMSQLGREGIVSELQHWDMDDIQSIEVIRGPGSVVYGPGAVAGVVNINTRSGKTAHGGVRVSTRYFSEYHSYGTNFSWAGEEGDLSWYIFGSVVQTRGADVDVYLNTLDDDGNIRYGFAGTGDFEGAFSAGQYSEFTSYDDFDNREQIKLNAKFNWKNNWELQARFTQVSPRTTVSQFGAEPYTLGIEQDANNSNQYNTIKGGAVNTMHTFTQEASAAIVYNGETDLWGGSDLYTRLAVRSQNRQGRGNAWQLNADSYTFSEPLTDGELTELNAELADLDGARNNRYNFSETELQLKSFITTYPSERLTLSAGTELKYTRFAAPWGKDRKDFRMGDNQIILSGTDSAAYNDSKLRNNQLNGIDANNIVAVGDGWDTYSVGLLGEGVYDLSDKWTANLSARIEKERFVDWTYSPRLAFVYQPNHDNVYKFIAQQSNRISTADQNYLADRSGNQGESETIQNYEFIYMHKFNKHWLGTVSTFFSDLETLGWSHSDQKTLPLGEQQIAGIEIVLDHMSKDWDAGISYSFIKQIKWDSADGINTNPFSVAEYGPDGIWSSGNDIMNGPAQMLKTYATYKATDKLDLHVDAYVLFDFRGDKESIQMLRRANADNPQAIAAIESMENQDMYEWDFRLNASARYELMDGLNLYIYARNLIANAPKRYQFNWGNTQPLFVYGYQEEPRSLGVKLEYAF